MKVLQVIDGETFGGISRLFYDIDNNIKDIDIDCLTSINLHDDWINMNVSRKSIFGRIVFNHRFSKYIKNNKYDLVHINSSAFFFSFSLVLICWLHGIKNIIVHAHNNPSIPFVKRILMMVLNPLYMKLTKVHLSCSDAASKSLFLKTDDVIVINNAVDIDRYKFNLKTRNKIRKQLGIDNKYVYGHIGRFDYQKNHDFLIDIFYELQKKRDSVLILIGDGKLENKIRNKIKKLNIEDKVFMLGYRNDVSDLLNAFDCYIFPSFYEGFGVSLIEAQINGVPVVASDSIPDIAKISNNFIKVKDYNVNEWVDFIIKVKSNNREKAYLNAIKKGYDSMTVSKIIKKIYVDTINSGDVK